MTVPFALSIHSFVNSVGAYVGLGSIVAVALLVLLYFAHARETATLRDRLDEAQQRIIGLEARLGQLAAMQQRGRGVTPAPVPVAPPVPVRPPGAPQGSVRRVPTPATAAGATAAAAGTGVAQAPVAARQATTIPSAPAGVAGPALASATRVIPDASPSGAPDDTMYIPAAAAGAATSANGRAVGEQTAVLGTAKATPAAAVSARAASASPRASVAAPPRMQMASDQEPAGPGAPPAATAAGAAGAPKVRRIGGRPEPAAVSLPAFDDDSVGGRFSGAVLPLLVAGVAVVVIIVGLIVISNSGGGSTSGNVNHNAGANTTGQSLHNSRAAHVPFDAANVKVAVLNGTAQQGLAGDVGKKLAGDGYKQGNIANAASQTEGSTFVYYVSSASARVTKANRVAARNVAKALALPPTRVLRAGSSVIQSCMISSTGASLASCSANVVVSVGQDRANLASASG